MYEHLAKLAEKIGQQIHNECPDPQEDASEITGEKIAEAIRAQDLKWTTEPPTVEGWYWARTNSTKNTIDVVKVYNDDGIWRVSIFENDWTFDLKYFTHWLGPLPVPEPPNQGL